MRPSSKRVLGHSSPGALEPAFKHHVATSPSTSLVCGAVSRMRKVPLHLPLLLFIGRHVLLVSGVRHERAQDKHAARGAKRQPGHARAPEREATAGSFRAACPIAANSVTAPDPAAACAAFSAPAGRMRAGRGGVVLTTLGRPAALEHAGGGLRRASVRRQSRRRDGRRA